MTVKAARTEMTYIDHCIRPPRLIIMATLLSLAFSLPASASNTKEVISSPIRKRRVSRRKLQFTTTANSADDAIESYKLLQQKGINATTVSSSSSSFAAQTTTSNGELICTPMEECELCPLKWKQLLDKDDEKIKGEFESCTKYGRRQEFECTVLFQENDTSEKVAKSKHEYKPCRFTDSDEAFRMLQMQLICLMVGLWSVRSVRRHRMSSASLFDQRRMRGNAIQGGGGGASDSNGSPSKHVKFSGYSRKDSLESVELGPLIQKTTGAGKVPKSPAPLNMNSV
mmetsp:Transcript_13526/g.27471  ORF Transcript_13526/g.27471 Transcript_13526/m.27471 type:complete len:284 (+) Transcript_13526:117-968(+)